MFLELFVCFTIFLVIFGYFYVRNRYSYWAVRGVKGPKPVFLFGNLLEWLGNNPSDIDHKWMLQYGKVYGLFNGLTPSLIIHEPELVKQVLIKDFPVFINRAKQKAYHEIWNENILFTKDEKWKRVRAITSPAFTSGKLKDMYPLMDLCVDKLVTYLDDLILNGTGVMDTKEVIFGFTIDVIATTSFGTETDANGNRSKSNIFVVNGRKLFNIDPWRVGALYLLPKFALRLINLKTFFDPKIFDFFIDYTRHILKERREDPAKKRNDIVQLLLDARVDENYLANDSLEKLSLNDATDQIDQNANTHAKSANKTLNDNQIIAQCIAFLVAGFETTAATIAHCLFELAHNVDIQERLNLEIQEKTSTLEDKSEVFFETVMIGMPYMDAVIKETLRKYPAIVRLNRYLEVDGYNLGGITLNRNDYIEIPVYAMHHCEEYYPEPAKFDPERFFVENRHKIKPYTYLPFGDGPRNCIGMRFAYQEIKLCMAKLIARYRFEVTPETPQKITFKFGNPQLNSVPFPLKITFR